MVNATELRLAAARALDAAMQIVQDSLFAALHPTATGEQVGRLLTTPGVRIERIVSAGQASPPGFWFNQEWDEFVLLMAGSAGLSIEGEAVARSLRPGDYLVIPAHVRHRVEWTSPSGPTIWLAVHCCPAGSEA